MRLTQALCRQHMGRMIKRHWWQSGKKTIRDTAAEEILSTHGIKVIDAKDVAPPVKLNEPRVKILDFYPKPPPLDATHPDWNDKPRLKFGNDSVLLDGIVQAQVLAKTQRINGLPAKLVSLQEEPSHNIENLITRFINSSHIFDAHQEKLPKKKDPLRPAYNFARIYGIPDVRKTHNLTQKLIQLCELISDPLIGQQRKIINDGHVRTYIERGNDLLYIETKFDTMLTSNKLITPMSFDNEELQQPLPDIHPLDPTISLQPENIYTVQDHYPIARESQWINPHTIFFSFNSEIVKNITELPITYEQIVARSLIKSFATAACCAKQKFGDHVIELPEPIIIQCVQSNGKWFDFSIFQLNTLDIADENGTKNIWWSEPRIELYDKAEYVSGRPTLEGYNGEVFKKILAFYRNV